MVVKQKIKNAIVIIVLAVLFGALIYGMVIYAKQQEAIHDAKMKEMVAEMERIIEEQPPIPIQFLLSLPDIDDCKITTLTHEKVIEMENISLRDKILMHLDNELVGDDMITVEGDIKAKRSNVEGLKINGETYYYALVPDASFDPCSTGKVTEKQINIIEEINFENSSVIIYTIKKGDK